VRLRGTAEKKVHRSGKSLTGKGGSVRTRSGGREENRDHSKIQRKGAVICREITPISTWEGRRGLAQREVVVAEYREMEGESVIVNLRKRHVRTFRGASH